MRRQLFSCQMMLFAIAFAVAPSDLNAQTKEEIMRTMEAAQSQAPKFNEMAPDFTLKTKNGQSEEQLSALRVTKPVVLIFGSYT